MCTVQICQAYVRHFRDDCESPVLRHAALPFQWRFIRMKGSIVKQKSSHSQHLCTYWIISLEFHAMCPVTQMTDWLYDWLTDWPRASWRLRMQISRERDDAATICASRQLPQHWRGGSLAPTSGFDLKPLQLLKLLELLEITSISYWLNCRWYHLYSTLYNVAVY
jgi:hypothetical protein